MKPGSVLVDLAVERGGNVEGAKPGEVVATDNGVKIVGHLNVPGRLAATASSLYARNLYAFVETLVDKEAKTLAVKWDDELVKATNLTRDGQVVAPRLPAQSLIPPEDTMATLPPDQAAEQARAAAAAARTAADIAQQHAAPGAENRRRPRPRPLAP